MKLNKFLMLFMVLALTVILAACNFGGEEEPPAEVETTDDGQTEAPVETEKVMNVLIASEPPSLHPVSYRQHIRCNYTKRF